MERKLLEQSQQYKVKHKKKRRFKKIFNILACVVVFCVTYALILPAITMEKKSYCGYEEHTHGDKCYSKALICAMQEGENAEGHSHGDGCYSEEKTLVCQLTESTGHTHSDACKTTETVLVCGTEESEEHIHSDVCYQVNETITCGIEESGGHTHGDGCYENKKVLVCTNPETETVEGHKHTDACYEKKMTCEKEEHEHKLICHSDKNADVEMASDWEATLPKELTGVWADDVLAIADSQLGYEESSKNYNVTEDGKTLGYTRYGDWYGDSYGHWCAMYVSFCLHYANVDTEMIPLDANCQHWIDTLSKEEYNLYHEAGTYEPVPGDLIFFNWDSDPRSEHIGLVVEYTPATEDEPAEVRTIEGNASDVVKYKTYKADDSRIMGYGELPENPELEEAMEKQTLEASIYTDETFETEAKEDKTVITVSGYFPEGIEAKAYPVELEEETIEGRRVLLAYDITLFDKDGNKYDTEELEIPMTVTIEPAEWSIEDEEVDSEDCEVYYVPEEGEPENMETSTEKDVVSFQTDHFSTYALTVGGTAGTVYLNGASGDDSRAGTSSGTAVKTLDKAFSLVKDGGTIYITGTVTVSDDVEIDVSEKITIKRGSDFTDALIKVSSGGNLKLGNITVNGGSDKPSSSKIATNSTYADGSAKAPLIVVNDGGRLTVAKGAVLEYNSNEPDSKNNKFVENSYRGLGGAIYCSGTLTMNGGLIQHCEAQCGGGVYVENGNFYLSGGTIDSCYARDIVSYNYREENYHKNAGGGVYVGDNTTMTMTGGTVSNNQSSREGGGISLGWLNRSDNAGIYSYITTFTMNGGTITGNYAVSTGGGLNIAAGRQAFINEGTITSNTALGREYQDVSDWFDYGQKYASIFSGGGIYIDAAQWSDYDTDKHAGVPGKAVINRALITDNTATHYGGGIAACGTSVNFIYGEENSKNGTAIYGNTAEDNKNTNELYVLDGSLKYSNYALGGGQYNWKSTQIYYESYYGREPDGIGYTNSLGNNSTAIKKAEGLATVFIKNNTAHLGGGIGCNGIIEIGGEKEESTYINIKKVWEDDGTVEHPEYIEVQILQDGKPYGEAVRIYRTINENGKEIWPTFYVGGLPSGHKYTVKELDVPGYMATIEQNGQDFVITNKPVGFQVVKKWLDENGNELTEDLPDYIEVQLYQNGVEYGDTVVLNAENEWTYVWQELPKKDVDGNPYTYTVKEVFVPEGFYSTAEGVIGENGKCVITNTKSQVTSVSVEKRWLGDMPDDASVVLQLLANGKPYGASVTLSNDTGWFYKWNDLPVYRANKEEVTYTVQEIEVSGYTTEISVGNRETADKTWSQVTGLESGKKYLLYTENGALAADSDGLYLLDVPDNIDEWTTLESSALWSYNNNKLVNDDNKYLGLTTSGSSWNRQYTFTVGTSGADISFSNGYLSTKVSGFLSSSTKYLGSISNRSASVVDSTENATQFTAYALTDSSEQWGELHYIVTNTKKSNNFSVNFAKYAKGGDELTLLAGAELALYKMDSSGSTIPGTTVAGTLVGEWTSKDATDATKGIHTVDLYSGTYYLVETKTPEGHAGLAGPIIFNVDTNNSTVEIVDYPGYEDLEGTADATDFRIYNEILYELPETGGMGTTTFYVLGAILVIGASVVMITRKRMSR